MLAKDLQSIALATALDCGLSYPPTITPKSAEIFSNIYFVGTLKISQNESPSFGKLKDVNGSTLRVMEK